MPGNFLALSSEELTLVSAEGTIGEECREQEDTASRQKVRLCADDDCPLTRIIAVVEASHEYSHQVIGDQNEENGSPKPLDDAPKPGKHENKRRRDGETPLWRLDWK